MTPLLTVEGLEKSFGNKKVLCQVSFDLKAGETTALLGANGSGKTTLIKILVTLLEKDRGKIRIFGYDMDRDEKSIRNQIGYVGQDSERSAYARLTVHENLFFFGSLRGMSRQLIHERILELAEYFAFSEHLDKQFITLSGGQKQTVVIIRALLHDPPLVFLDEPTKGLDPAAAQNIRRYLNAYIEEQGKSLLLTSHILQDIEEMAHRMLFLHDGRIQSGNHLKKFFLLDRDIPDKKEMSCHDLSN